MPVGAVEELDPLSDVIMLETVVILEVTGPELLNAGQLFVSFILFTMYGE